MSDELQQPELSDDDLLRLLAGVLDDHEPIPEVALAAAYSAADMDLLAEELAALVFDSAGSSAGELVAVRGTEVETRLLSFVNDHVAIDLELHADGTTVVGQIMPATEEPLQVETEGGEAIEVVADEFGRFRFTSTGGPMRLRVVGVVVTPWITR